MAGDRAAHRSLIQCSGGYFDQPHLSRALKHFIGLTPLQLRDNTHSVQLSFLYKTTPFALFNPGR